MPVIVVANHKGGVGKTTLSLHLARLFAEEGPTLAVDVDPHHNLTSCLFPDGPPQEASMDLLYAGKLPTPARSTGRLAALGATLSMARHESEGGWSFHALRPFLEKLGDEYATIVVDCPPNLGLFTTSAMIAGDWLLAPVDASGFALDGLEDLFDAANGVRARVPFSTIRPLGIVVTMEAGRTKYARAIVTALRKQYDARLLDTRIPATVRMREALDAHATIFDTYPHSNAAIAYRALYEEIKRRMTA